MTARVAIVTGASSGIGLGITRALLERGYRVVANSRTISDSKDLRPSASLVLVDGDLGKKETAMKVADAAVEHFDHIDLLVNNAGIYLESAPMVNGENIRIDGGAHAGAKW
jgi:NAD(P)-dependent dehydrogenase (short-subunit alcohol dehydrogenase family)